MRRASIVTWIKITVGIVAFGLLQIGIVHALSPTAMRFGLQRWPDASGFVGNWSPYGAINTRNAFFQPPSSRWAPTGAPASPAISRATDGASRPHTPRDASPRPLDETRSSAPLMARPHPVLTSPPSRRGAGPIACSLVRVCFVYMWATAFPPTHSSRLSRLATRMAMPAPGISRCSAAPCRRRTCLSSAPSCGMDVRRFSR